MTSQLNRLRITVPVIRVSTVIYVVFEEIHGKCSVCQVNLDILWLKNGNCHGCTRDIVLSGFKNDNFIWLLRMIDGEGCSIS